MAALPSLCLLLSLGSRAVTAPGPDAFGYSVGRTTAFAFTNIVLGYPTNGSRRVLNFDDDESATVNIGFSFNFYGSDYSTVSFTPNGLMTFGGTNSAYSNVNLTISIPGANLPCAAVLWDDWETESEGPADRGVYYRTDGSAGNRRLILQWQHLQPILDNDTVTFEAVLFEGNNQILFSYLDVVVSDNPGYGNGAFATVGIRDLDGQLNGRSLQWSYNQAAVSNGLNLIFTRSNHPPVALPDSATTAHGLPVIINVLANDSDLDGNPLTIISAGQGSNGSVVINAGTTVTYAPQGTAPYTDSFGYTITDGQGGSSSATVTVAVILANDPPVATDDDYAVDEDTVLTVSAPGVLLNDNDPNGDSLTAVPVAGVQHGVLRFNPDGSFTYQPNTNYNGTDSFLYRAFDGTLNSSNATVTILVRSVNDPPEALGGVAITQEEVPASFTLRGTDVDGDTLSYAVVALPANGELSGTPPDLIYRPFTNFAGNDSLLYVVNDGQGGSSTGTVFVTVTPVDDGPPIAGPDFADAYQGTALMLSVQALLVNDTDVDPEDNMTVINVSPTSAAGGTVTLTNEVVYLSPTNFTGTDTFTYTVTDGNGGSDTGLVTVTVWPSLQITLITRLAEGSVRMRFQSIAGRTNLIETSTDLINWLSIGSAISDLTGAAEYEDAAATNHPIRFYRAVDPQN